jgi:hypothetical protein
MIARSRPVAVQRVPLSSESSDRRAVGSDLAGQLIQATLALYLAPALVLVLMVGAMGMLAIMVGRLFAGPVHSPAD